MKVKAGGEHLNILRQILAKGRTGSNSESQRILLRIDIWQVDSTGTICVLTEWQLNTSQIIEIPTILDSGHER